jgi:hypothetical protein
MVLPYDQATERYFAEALAHGDAVRIDSPNRGRSQLRRKVWHLRNFDGLLIAQVGRDFVRFVPP